MTVSGGFLFKLLERYQAVFVVVVLAVDILELAKVTIRQPQTSFCVEFRGHTNPDQKTWDPRQGISGGRIIVVGIFVFIERSCEQEFPNAGFLDRLEMINQPKKTAEISR